MAAKRKIPERGLYIAAVFHDAEAFVGALDALLRAGFDRSSVSVLAGHEAVKDHFGRIPDVNLMADRRDTPREDLDAEGALYSAIRTIAETIAIIGQIGMAGVAYAVGGPIGIASGASTAADLTVSDVLGSYVGRQYRDRYAESIREGGVIAWVHVRDDAQRNSARTTLKVSGAEHVHEVDL
jgi:hypothetical protein